MKQSQSGGGFVEDNGPIQTTKQPPLSNDSFTKAYPISKIPFRGETSTAGAQRQSGDPTGCIPAGGVAWYRYTTPASGALFADTFGSDYSLTLGVFSGTSQADLQQVSCQTNAAGNADATFAVVKGRTYYFQITGPVNGGHLLFTLVQHDPSYAADLIPGATGGSSYNPFVSANGRYVTFFTFMDQAAPNPSTCRHGNNYCETLIWRDLKTGIWKRVVSVVSSIDVNDPAYYNYVANGAVSSDGVTVVFDGGPGITPDKHSINGDVFVKNMTTGVIHRISGSWRGGDAHANPTDPIDAGLNLLNQAEGNGQDTSGAIGASISADGRFVGFNSRYADLYPGEPSSPYWQYFVKDLKTGRIRMVSVDPTGAPANAISFTYTTQMSADGRWVSFFSLATNLAPGLPSSPGCVPQVTNFESSGLCHWGVYLADIQHGTVMYVSRSTTGISDGDSMYPAVSADGNHVVFTSNDSHLVSSGTNGSRQVFEWDRSTGFTSIVSTDSTGKTVGSVGIPYAVLPPADTAYGLTNLVPYDTVCSTLHPLVPQICHELGVGMQAFGGLFNGSIGSQYVSADGRYVAFDTIAPLETDDTNNASDIYVHDTVTGATVRVSVGPLGEQANGDSFGPFISDDGSTLAYTSSATNIAPRQVPGSFFNVIITRLNWTR
ncbi:MAG: hypothetical protein ACYDCC_06605 [Actinomycetota bacterium]